jgi:ribosomal protein S18 acetylase RimI-like enzyme
VEIATDLLRQLGYHVPANELAGRIAQLSTAEGHYAAVADDGQKICGLIHVYERPSLQKPRAAVVQSLIVEERARKTGAGRLLMRAAEAWAQERGLNYVVLHTRIDRDDARAFYERIRVHENRDRAPYEQPFAPGLIRERVRMGALRAR